MAVDQLLSKREDQDEEEGECPEENEEMSQDAQPADPLNLGVKDDQVDGSPLSALNRRRRRAAISDAHYHKWAAKEAGDALDITMKDHPEF